MKIITAYQDFKDFRNSIESVSFVPTMGNLHNGHMALIDKAKSYDSHVVASIFINPLQFNDASDFKNYPKSIDDDIAILSEHGCDSLFIPDSSILEDIKEIKAPDKALYLCGMNSPGHFDGVLTIVNKLFEIIKPSRSFFGKKDFQQLTLISNFVKENNLVNWSFILSRARSLPCTGTLTCCDSGVNCNDDTPNFLFALYDI